MKKYFEYFSEEAIEKFLIKERVKRARRRDKYHKFGKIASKNSKYRIPPSDTATDIFLKKYLPPRREWIRPGRELRCRFNRNCNKRDCRKECKKRQNYNSIDIECISLKLTIDHLMRIPVKPATHSGQNLTTWMTLPIH